MPFDLFKDMPVTTGAIWRDPKECARDAFWHRSFFDGLRAQAHVKFFVDEAPGTITVAPGEFVLTLENASPMQQAAVQSEASWLSLAVQYGVPADALTERYTRFATPATKTPTDWARLILGWTLERAVQFCQVDLVLQPRQLSPQPAAPAMKKSVGKSTLSEITGRIQSSDIISLAQARSGVGKIKAAPPLPHPAPNETSF